MNSREDLEDKIKELANEAEENQKPDTKLIQELEQLPQKIKEKTMELYAITLKTDKNKFKKATIEAIITAEIIQQTNDEGKKLFTNDQARKAELTYRLNRNNEYQQYMQEETKLKLKKTTTEAELTYYNNRMRAIEIIAKLGGKNAE